MLEENLEKAQQGWDAWLRGDMEALVALWDPDIVWDTEHMHEWPESRYHGIDGIRRFLSEWLEVWGDYEIEIDQVLLAPDGRVVSLIRHHGKGRQSGVPLELEMAQVATLRDGRFVRLDNYDDRAEALKTAGIE